MGLDSGSHPTLYKIGMKIADKNPKLFDTGVQLLNYPNKVKQELDFKLKNKKLGGKINSVNLEITVKCNLRCSFCWFYGSNDKGEKTGIAFKWIKEQDPMITKELSKEEIFKIVDELAVSDRPSWYLSGAEPFSRNDTVDLIEYITNNNGTFLTEERLQRLAKIKKLTINFSIDGPRDVHDKIRGQGVYDKATQAISRLVELRGDSIYPAVKTNTTFSPWIMGRMDEMIHDIQDRVGADAMRMQQLWFTDPSHAELHKKQMRSLFGATETGGIDAHVISTFNDSYLEKLADEIGRIEKTKYKKPIFIHPRLSHDEIIRYYKDYNFTKQKRCYIAWGQVMIRSNGNVSWCPDDWAGNMSIGNIRENSIKELWNNEKAQKFREELYKRSLFASCNRCCVINS